MANVLILTFSLKQWKIFCLYQMMGISSLRSPLKWSQGSKGWNILLYTVNHVVQRNRDIIGVLQGHNKTQAIHSICLFF